MCLQETWLKDKILEAEVHIEGYRNYKQDRGGERKGGGTAKYVSTTLTVTKNQSHRNGMCDAVYVEIEEMHIGVINILGPLLLTLIVLRIYFNT